MDNETAQISRTKVHHRGGRIGHDGCCSWVHVRRHLQPAMHRNAHRSVSSRHRVPRFLCRKRFRKFTTVATVAPSINRMHARLVDHGDEHDRAEPQWDLPPVQRTSLWRVHSRIL